MEGRTELIEIDLSAVNTPRELHSALARALGFPHWYGHNWDAFWDAITGLVEMPRRLQLDGWAGLAARLPDDARHLRRCLDDLAAEYPDTATRVDFN